MNAIHHVPRIALNTFVVGLVTLLSRIFGLLRDSIIASSFGAGLVTDCFFVAFRVPNLVRRICADGAIAPLVVPALTRCQSKAEIAANLSSLLTLVLTYTVPPTVVAFLFPEFVSWIFAPGFPSDALSLCGQLLRIIIGYSVLVAAIAVLSAALNVLGKFVLPALSQVIFNIVLIVAVLVVAPLLEQPVLALAWGVIVGGIIPLSLLLFSLFRQGIQLTLRLGSSPVVGANLPAIIVSSATYQINSLIIAVIASTLPSGSVSWLYYADRLFQFPLGIFVYALITAAFPELAKLAAEAGADQFAARVNQVTEWLLFITIPASVGLIILSAPIVGLCFGHGEFTDRDILETSYSLRAYAFGLTAFSCQTIFVRAMQSRGAQEWPIRIGWISIFFTTFLSILLTSEKWSFMPGLGHQGLALAISLATWLSVVPAIKGLRLVGVELSGDMLRSALKMTLSAILMAGAVIETTAHLEPIALQVLAGIFAGVIVYSISCWLLGVRLMREILQLSLLRNVEPR